MKLVTLLENTSLTEKYRHAHGLSLYLETRGLRILFDTGPNDAFAENAEKLGVDLSAVDLAILSHGHYDHGGGLLKFLEMNHRAKVCIHPGAFGDYYAVTEGELRRIGLNPELKRYAERFLFTENVTRLSDGLTLFDGVEDVFGGAAASNLKEKVNGELIPDTFAHEQDLLVTEGGKSIVLAGCAHRGIVNIREKAAALLGREPDVMVGGFHLFQIQPGDTAGEALIDRIGRSLAKGNTVYYSGHCTGEYAYGRLKGILGERLIRLSSGAVFMI